MKTNLYIQTAQCNTSCSSPLNLTNFIYFRRNSKRQTLRIGIASTFTAAHRNAHNVSLAFQFLHCCQGSHLHSMTRWHDGGINFQRHPHMRRRLSPRHRWWLLVAHLQQHPLRFAGRCPQPSVCTPQVFNFLTNHGFFLLAGSFYRHQQQGEVGWKSRRLLIFIHSNTMKHGRTL